MRFWPIVLVAAPVLAQEYVRDIQPLWEKYCFGCHFTGVKMGSFELTTYQELMQSGPNGRLVIPGDSRESRLYQMVAGKTAPFMPLGATMRRSEIATVRSWIDTGAYGPDSPAQRNSAYSIAAVADDSILVGGFGRVRWIDLESKATKATFEGPQGAVLALGASRSGAIFAAGGGAPGIGGEVRVFDLRSRKLLWTLKGHDDSICSLAFSADGRVLATSAYDGQIKLWDVDGGRERRRLPGGTEAPRAIGFSRDGLPSGMPALAISPDGSHVAGVAPGGLVRLFAVKGSNLLWETATETGQSNWISGAAFSNDGQSVFVLRSDGRVTVYEAQSGKVTRTLVP